MIFYENAAAGVGKRDEGIRLQTVGSGSAKGAPQSVAKGEGQRASARNGGDSGLTVDTPLGRDS